MKPTLLFYAPSFDSLGGGEVWVNRIANGLAERGWTVHVVGKRPPITPVRQQWAPGVTSEYLERAPDRVLEVGRTASRPRRLLTRLATSAAAERTRSIVDRVTFGWRPSGTFLQDVPDDARRRLADIVDRLQERADGGRVVIVCTDVYTGSHIADARAVGRLSAPYFVMHHNSFDSLNRGTARAYRAAAQDAEALVALTDEDAERFRSAGTARVVVMHNPRPPLPPPTPAPTTDGTRIVVWLARMTAVKSGSTAIRAWAVIARRFPEWRLHMYGDGPERVRLENLSSRLGTSASVIFPGVAHDSSAVFATASINLLTSRFEGWALVIGEAAVHAVPTVAADNSPGVRLQIEDGDDGLLVPVGDVAATARALARLMEDDTFRTRMGSAAERTSARFDLDEILERWDALLRDAR